MEAHTVPSASVCIEKVLQLPVFNIFQLVRLGIAQKSEYQLQHHVLIDGKDYCSANGFMARKGSL